MMPVFYSKIWVSKFVFKTKILHYIFTISQQWLTSHLRSTEVLLDTGTPGTSRKFTMRMPIMGLDGVTSSSRIIDNKDNINSCSKCSHTSSEIILNLASVH